MSDGYVRTTTEGGIATVTFHHPKSNSLPAAILGEMAKQISTAGADKTVRAIILRSDGEKAFCAGASFDELVAIETEAQGLTFFNGFANVINAIRTVPCFVLGRVQNKAVGGGVGLAAAVDVCYAHASASVKLSELAIGIGPFVVGPAVERKTGTNAFGFMTSTPATWRSADWALRNGLVRGSFRGAASLGDRDPKTRYGISWLQSGSHGGIEARDVERHGGLGQTASRTRGDQRPACAFGFYPECDRGV
jgi:methylglutaconyl-CoA hydratase